MTTVSVTKEITVSAAAAWEKLSSFRGIENFSPIERSVTTGEGEGSTRSCFMPDNAEIKEELTKVDNNTMDMEYIIHSGPFPFTDYVSTVSVNATNNGCSITWACVFNAAEENQKPMQELLTGFYNAMIEGLETLINKEAVA